MNQAILLEPVLGHDVPGQPLAGLWSFFGHLGYHMCWDRASGSTLKGPDRNQLLHVPCSDTGLDTDAPQLTLVGRELKMV